MSTKSLFITLLMAFLGCKIVAAQGTEQELVVSRMDNTEVAILLSENPIVKFSGVKKPMMSIQTKNNQYAFYVDDLDKMKMVKSGTTLKAELLDSGILLKRGDDALLISSPSEDILTIYDMSGRIYFTKKKEHGQYVIPLSKLPKGVYIIKINAKILKMQNK